jgi:hypothetical protein
LVVAALPQVQSARDSINEIANNVMAITFGNWSNSKRSVAELAYAAAVSARVWLR